jgi:hypothetical protein
MFAALHGSFAPHPWRTGQAEGPVPDYLLRDRTQAMHWSPDVGGGVGLAATGVKGIPNLWDVRDAGPDRLVATELGEPAAWFHVAVRTSPEAPLPVRPFLAACDDAVARLGRLDLTAAQILLPVTGLDPSHRTAQFPHVDGIGWWAGCDPAAEFRVSISVDGGRSPSVIEAVPSILTQLNGLDQQVVTVDATSLRRTGPDPRGFVLSDHLWPGPPGGGVTFEATLVEWSLDTIGWLGALVADIAVAEGVRTPLLLTVSINR